MATTFYTHGVLVEILLALFFRNIAFLMPTTVLKCIMIVHHSISFIMTYKLKTLQSGPLLKKVSVCTEITRPHFIKWCEEKCKEIWQHGPSQMLMLPLRLKKIVTL